MTIRTGDPSYRIFTYFNEITEDVVSVTVTWGYVESTCTITISNKNNKYILTKENVEDGIWTEDEKVKRDIYSMKKDYQVKGQPVYDLFESECIFHCGDPVKVYFKDPHSSQWWKSFSGYFTPVTDSYDSQSDKFVISLRCEDTKRWIRQTRLGIGVYGGKGPLDYATPDEQQNNVITTVFQNLPAGITLEEIFIWLILGTPPESLSVGGTVPSSISRAGNFLNSDVQYVKDKSQFVSIQSNIINSLKINYEDIESDGLTYGWSEAGLLSVDGTLRMILPEFFKDFRAINPLNIITQVGYRDEYRDRLAILQDYAELLNFLFYTLPNGDIILEFPQYDLVPADYGDELKEIFTVSENEVSTWDITEDDSNVQTAWFVTGTISQWFQKTDASAELSGLLGMAVRESLVPRFGWKVMQTNHPIVATQEGAELIANTLLNKSFVDAKSMSIKASLKIPVCPGRPYRVYGRNYMGFCTSVTHTITWARQASSSIALGYLRGWNRDKQMWTAIGGDSVGRLGSMDYGEAFGSGRNEKE